MARFMFVRSFAGLRMTILNSSVGKQAFYCNDCFVILNKRSAVKDLMVYCAVRSVVHSLGSWDSSVGKKRSE